MVPIMGGGLNGQDAYSGRIIAVGQSVPERGWDGAHRRGERDVDSHDWVFL